MQSLQIQLETQVQEASKTAEGMSPLQTAQGGMGKRKGIKMNTSEIKRGQNILFCKRGDVKLRDGEFIAFHPEMNTATVKLSDGEWIVKSDEVFSREDYLKSKFSGLIEIWKSDLVSMAAAGRKFNPSMTEVSIRKILNECISLGLCPARKAKNGK